MMRPGPAAARRRRRGFTLTEMIVASMLASLLMILLAVTWLGFGRPALEVEARARIQQEGILAAQSLACDLGGFLADSPGRTGAFLIGSASSPYQFLSWDLSQGNVLLLNFEGPSGNQGDLIIITYQLQGNLLVRSDSSTGVTTTVAKYVTGFSVAPNPSNTQQALIQIAISYRYFTSTYTLIGVPPS
ncbi:MAG TPA: prepilin-type N-terminal cleavage/methylation domain-containing protein [Isosphaeraceae bacterium]|nr:prepilin-type N-terminal cleavage/methylation domain-containing protein [Isosphaeraceae bacterium]